MQFMIAKVISTAKNPAALGDYSTHLNVSLESLAYSKRLQEQGKILFHAIVAGSSTSYWIVEANSAEEVDLMLKGLPIFPQLQIDVKPLVSPEHVESEIKQYMAANQMKIQPSGLKIANYNLK